MIDNRYLYLFCRGAQPIDGGGLGQERPDGLNKEDDEYSAYRKRMMLAYRFRPNPLVSWHAFFSLYLPYCSWRDWTILDMKPFNFLSSICTCILVHLDYVLYTSMLLEIIYSQVKSMIMPFYDNIFINIFIKHKI